jgi:hypothetical protein
MLLGLFRRLLLAVGRPWLVAAGLAAMFGLAAWQSADFRVVDADVFWLAAAGRDMVLHHAMPHVNGYSFADGSRPWVLHEGLFALYMFSGIRSLGPAFFALHGLLAGAVTASLAAAWLVWRSRSPAACCLAGVVLFSSAPAFFYPRPLYASLSLAVAMIMLVFRPGWSLGRGLLVLLLELVWTNAHGSFGLGVALVAAGALDDGRSRRERRAWLLTALGAGFVTLVNPYGLALHGLVGRYLHAADPMAEVIQTHIMSFFSLPASVLAGNFDRRAIASLALIGAVALRDVVRRRRVARALVALVGVGMAVYQVRHIVLAIVLGVLLLHGAADDLVGRTRPGPRLRRAVWTAAFVVLPGLLAGTVKWGRAFAERAPVAWIDAGQLGGEPFLRLIDALPDGARVFAPFKPSSLVIWYEAPRGVKVLYDARNDCYSAAVAKGALELDWPHRPRTTDGAVDRRVANFLEAHGTEYVLTWKGVILDDLSHDARWETVRRDGPWTELRQRRQPGANAGRPSAP